MTRTLRTLPNCPCPSGLLLPPILPLLMAAVLLSLVLLLPHRTAAQDTGLDTTRASVSDDLERAIDERDPEGEGDAEQLSQVLIDLAENPVNINRADLWTLLQVPGMNLRLGQAILDYRTQVKPYESVDELSEARGIGPVTLERFRPYVTAGEPGDLRRDLYGDLRYWTHNGDLEMFSRYRRILEPQDGYRRSADEGGYLGSPLQYYQRTSWQSDKLSFNLTSEKDAGEPLASIRSFDYLSWHAAVHDLGRLRTAVAGDYSLSFGQGLVLWSGGIFGKGSEVISAPVRSGGGIRPWSSAQENGSLRGAAATWGDRLQFTGFWSARRYGATRVAADTVRLPRDDGYYRTVAELDRKEAVRQVLFGGRLQGSVGRGVIGATAWRTRFGSEIDPGSAPYQRYGFRGREHAVGGLDWALPAGPLLLFGEGARSANGGYGMVAGIEGAAGGQTRLTAVYRNYGQRFQSFMGGGFGEGSGDPQNEEGIYLGVRHEAGPHLTLSGYVDHFHFPAPRFGVNRSSGGHEWLLRADYEMTRDLEGYLQIRSERKEDEFETAGPAGRTLRLSGNRLRTTARAHLQYRVHPDVRWRSRLEVARGGPAGGGRETGWLIYQDLRIQPHPALTVDARVTVFNAATFESRIYQYENNLLYVMSNQLLYGEGQRLYLLLHCTPLPFLDIWTKVGTTVYEDRSEIGEGLERIDGNSRTDFGVQVRLRF